VVHSSIDLFVFLLKARGACHGTRCEGSWALNAALILSANGANKWYWSHLNCLLLGKGILYDSMMIQGLLVQSTI
jgi:hypothetical protein